MNTNNRSFTATFYPNEKNNNNIIIMTKKNIIDKYTIQKTINSLTNLSY